MPTLSIVRADFKKLLKYGGIVLSILLVLFLSFKFLMFMKSVLFPPPPPAASTGFGKLPEINFPQSINKDFSYEIDTLTGDLPIMPDMTNVYKMEERGPDILAVDNASNIATSLGFDRDPQQISDYVYKWTNPNPPNQILIRDIRLDEFNLTSSFLNFENELERKFYDDTEAYANARYFLQKLDIFTEDIDEEKTIIQYQILKNGIITPTERYINSNIATVYFFQNDKDSTPIVYPQAKKSSMKIVVPAGRDYEWVLEANYTHQNILDETETYPLKTTEQALEDLKNGNAFISSHSGDNVNIKIKDVYLALYSEGQLQKYLTPVLVFEGDNNFTAYVPAITDEWFDK